MGVIVAIKPKITLMKMSNKKMMHSPRMHHFQSTKSTKSTNLFFK